MPIRYILSAKKLDVVKAAQRHRRLRKLAKSKRLIMEEQKELKAFKAVLDTLTSAINDYEEPLHVTGLRNPLSAIPPLGEPSKFPSFITASNPVNYINVPYYEPDGYTSDPGIFHSRSKPTSRIVGARRFYLPSHYNKH